MPLLSVELGYTDTRSDKVYKVWIVEAGTSLFNVTFAYGRRHSTLNTGVKNNDPVTLQKAEVIADKLIKSKLKKGYSVEGSGGTSAPTVPTREEVTDWFDPMLLTATTTIEALYWAAEQRIAFQVKRDGERRGVRIDKDGVTGASRLRKTAYVETSEALKAIAHQVGGDMVLDTEDCGAKIYVFDIMNWKGADLRGQSFSVRAAALADLKAEVQKLPAELSAQIVVDVPFVPQNGADAERFINDAIKENEEGVVLKDLDASYEPGKANSDGPARKLKFWESATVIVGAATKAKRSVEMFVSEAGQQQFVGRVTIPANASMPSEGSLAEVRYLYAMAGGSLIQPVYLGSRTDVTETAATLAQLKMKKAA